MTRVNTLIVVTIYVALIALFTDPNLPLQTILALLALPCWFVFIYCIHVTVNHYFQIHALADAQSTEKLVTYNVTRFLLLTPMVLIIIYNCKLIAYTLSLYINPQTTIYPFFD